MRDKATPCIVSREPFFYQQKVVWRLFTDVCVPQGWHYLFSYDLFSEPQARAIACEGCIPEGTENAGDILNNKGTMEYSQGQMSVTFRNMQLKKIKRADRKGQEVGGRWLQNTPEGIYSHNDECAMVIVLIHSVNYLFVVWMGDCGHV